ncbi:hypothetical protein BS50DRAFT_568456 [Corynespora cassiicola Philippines]|uniref:Secreted protein n=1 Tax=Corynespora cassiicola Philippines TaxID=1448308 RepID=A0A2T2P5D8_CORCC|nr:hypothetical protein BS50DRAFT_568456 [Corynespora cassiicola Philippines]
MLLLLGTVSSLPTAISAHGADRWMLAVCQSDWGYAPTVASHPSKGERGCRWGSEFPTRTHTVRPIRGRTLGGRTASAGLMYGVRKGWPRSSASLNENLDVRAIAPS